MTRPFKFRYVNEIVGVFVLLILAALIAAVLAAGAIQGWRDERREYVIVLPADVPTGLRNGSDVQIFGTSVGSVRDIRVAPDGEMTAEVRLRGDLIHFVRADSRAVIRKKFGLAGDAFIEISRGTGRERPPGDRIAASLDEDLTSLLVTALQEISDAVKYTMFQVNRLLEEYTSLAGSLERPVRELGLLLNETRDLVGSVRSGEGTAGRLLTDDALYRESAGLLADLRRTLAGVDEILAGVRGAADDLPGLTVETANLLAQVRSTLTEFERLVQGIQNHWALRRYIPGESGAPALLPAPGLPLGEAP